MNREVVLTDFDRVLWLVVEKFEASQACSGTTSLLKHQFDLSDIHLTLPITTLWRTIMTDPAMEAAVLPLVDGCSAKGTKEWTSQLQVSTTRLRTARAQDL